MRLLPVGQTPVGLPPAARVDRPRWTSMESSHPTGSRPSPAKGEVRSPRPRGLQLPWAGSLVAGGPTSARPGLTPNGDAAQPLLQTTWGNGALAGRSSVSAGDGGFRSAVLGSTEGAKLMSNDASQGMSSWTFGYRRCGLLTGGFCWPAGPARAAPTSSVSFGTFPLGPWFAAPQRRASSRATTTGRRPSLASISPRVLYS
jgi:hypothetical protein